MVVGTPTSAPNPADAMAALLALLPKADALVAHAPEAWLISADPTVLASDLALLVEPLGADELRIRIASTARNDDQGREIWRVTVAVRDRPGLLAGTAAVASQHRLSIASARCASWPREGLALQEVELVSAESNLSGEPDWPWIGQDLRTALTGGELPVARFLPRGRAEVSITEEGDQTGRWRVRVEAPDAVGLLAALCRWVVHAGANIEAAIIGNRGEDSGAVAVDELVVSAGPGFDHRAAELGDQLSRPG